MMKKLEKMSLANIKGKLTRKEMKNIMAGSGSDGTGMSLFECTVFCRAWNGWGCEPVGGHWICRVG